MKSSSANLNDRKSNLIFKELCDNVDMKPGEQRKKSCHKNGQERTNSNKSITYKREKTSFSDKFSSSPNVFQRAFSPRRRNEFSCHDKALRAAGFDMAEFDPFHKEMRERLRRDRERRQSMRVNQDWEETGRPDPASFAAAAETAAQLAKQKRKLSTIHPAKDGMYTEILDSSTIKADPEKLIEYLYLVKEFPDEYRALQRAFDDTQGKPVKDLIGKSELFNRYKDKKEMGESVVQMAAYELGGRRTHPVLQRYEEIESEKERAIQKGTLKSIRTVGLSNAQLKQIEQELYGKGVIVDDDLTPLERARAEVELWMRDKTTAQIIKAKELALKVLQEEDKSIRLWWSSHRPCRYIRRADSVASLTL